ncbi:MAG: hypothetical protein KBS95_07635 [Alistipes sp.]|nr:hypothetical protein [Candidatus Alistipes equi]
MGFFTPYKKHANRFEYAPRFFDPEKERREQRRRELRGSDSQSDEIPYEPGQYLRTMRDARRERSNVRKGASAPKMVIFLGVVLLVLFVYILWPRLVATFSKAHSTPKTEEIEEFNPYTPITIVPNDYEEENGVQN